MFRDVFAFQFDFDVQVGEGDAVDFGEFDPVEVVYGGDGPFFVVVR